MSRTQIFFDCDGIMRNLAGYIRLQHDLKPIPSSWKWEIKGKDIFELVAEDMSVLVRAPTLPYYEVIKKLDYVPIISSQPANWRVLTQKWVNTHFAKGQAELFFTNDSDEKLKFLENGDYLVDDSPKFSTYKQIILVEYAYNKHVTGEFARVKSPAELEKILKELL